MRNRSSMVRSIFVIPSCDSTGGGLILSRVNGIKMYRLYFESCIRRANFHRLNNVHELLLLSLGNRINQGI
ncbi:unnamed protein product [Arabidopsis halleri]